MHKTGTTSIQNALLDAAERLKEKRILFPDAGQPPGQAGQHMLAWAVRKEKAHRLPSPPPDVWGDLLREIILERPDKVIISAEDFEGAREEEVRIVREKLGSYEVHIIIYIREPFSHLESRYKQRVKQGRCFISFSRFVREYAYMCDYRSLVRRWEHFFGQDKIVVRQYEASRKVGLILDFARVVGAERSLLERGVTANVSPSNEVIQAIRYLNILERILSFGKYDGISGRRAELFHKIRRGLLRKDRLSRAILSFGGLATRKTLYSKKDKVWLQQAISAWDKSSHTILSTNKARVYESNA